jgi:hypothetical protein
VDVRQVDCGGQRWLRRVGGSDQRMGSGS